MTAVAQGNHEKGYRGAMIQDYDGENEKVVARCKHHHPTTGEARACINAAWFRHREVAESHAVDGWAEKDVPDA